MTNNIFITFSPSSQAEESTALRLQTISNLYGLSVALPYRQKTNAEINTETKKRIDNSTFIVAFCADGLTKFVKEELNYAILKKKPIVVIYDTTKGKKINFKTNTNIKEVFVDFNKTDDALHSIANFIRSKIQITQVKRTKQQTTNNDSGVGVALLGIGLGLLAAWALSKEKS